MSFLNNFKARKAYMRHVEGNQCSDRGEVEKAKAKYEEALALYAEITKDPNCKHIYLEAYSVLLMRYRRFEEAMALLRRADKYAMPKPDKLKLRVNYAVCQWKLGRLEQAIELMENVFHDLKNSLVYGSLGYMYIEQAVQTGDYSKAIEFNQAAYEYDEDDAVVLDNMGQLYLNMGEVDKALGYFEKAHELKPKQVDTLYYLAKIYHGQGKDDRARGLLDEALRGNYSALATTTREMAQKLREEIG
ncbi:MAG: tetratricopeptide repeat protein [Eubacteriales bacterium]|nr:tetratricopeptide repeat protein [Eubacteriales bacterium]